MLQQSRWPWPSIAVKCISSVSLDRNLSIRTACKWSTETVVHDLCIHLPSDHILLPLLISNIYLEHALVLQINPQRPRRKFLRICCPNGVFDAPFYQNTVIAEMVPSNHVYPGVILLVLCPIYRVWLFCSWFDAASRSSDGNILLSYHNVWDPCYRLESFPPLHALSRLSSHSVFPCVFFELVPRPSTDLDDVLSFIWKIEIYTSAIGYGGSKHHPVEPDSRAGVPARTNSPSRSKSWRRSR